MMNTHQMLCQMCTTKNETSNLRRIQLIKSQIERKLPNRISAEADKEAEKMVNLYGGRYDIFHVNHHCRYGIHCHSLENLDSQCRRESDGLPKLIALASMYMSKAEMHEVLRLMGGYFPMAYRYTEKIVSNKK